MAHHSSSSGEPEHPSRRHRIVLLGTVAALCVLVLIVAVVAVVASSTGSPHGAGKPTASLPLSSSPTLTGAPSSTASTSHAFNAPLLPASGDYLGAVSETGDTTQQGRIDSVLKLESAMGRKLGIVHVYHKWADTFPTKSDNYFLERGSTLMLSWAGTDTRLIASGADDSVIRRWAASVKAVNVPLFVEWRWEMDRPNLRVETWSGPDYVRAWTRIRKIFAEQGATNAVWVWCPTAAGFGTGQAQAFYPGDAEVDWLCADSYAVDSMQPLGDNLRPFLAWASQHAKPVMIGEFGAEPRGSGERAAWLLAVGALAKANPQIRALVYFDYDSLEKGRLFRWSLNSEPSALAAFRTLGKDPAFQAGR